MTGAPGAGLGQPLKPGRSQRCGTPAPHAAPRLISVKLPLEPRPGHGGLPPSALAQCARPLAQRQNGAMEAKGPAQLPRLSPLPHAPRRPAAPAGPAGTRSHCTPALTQMPSVGFPVSKSRLASPWPCPASPSPRIPDPGACLCEGWAGPGSGQPGPWKTCAQCGDSAKTPWPVTHVFHRPRRAALHGRLWVTHETRDMRRGPTPPKLHPRTTLGRPEERNPSDWSRKPAPDFPNPPSSGHTPSPAAPTEPKAPQSQPAVA